MESEVNQATEFGAEMQQHNPCNICFHIRV